MPKNKTFHSFAKWFKRFSLILLLVPLAVIICRIIIFATDNGHSSSTVLTNAEEAIKYLTLINAITGVLWFFLAIVMFFAAGTLRGVGASPLAIRIGLIITFALVFADVILSLVFQFHPTLKDQDWVPWIQTFIPLFNVAGYIVGAIVGSKLKNALA